MKAALLWSGGKDGALALILAEEEGVSVECILHFRIESPISFFHSFLPFSLLEEQLSLTGREYKVVHTKDYEESFKKKLKDLKEKGFSYALFGDIAVDVHRRWIESICKEVSIIPLFPLWGRDTVQLCKEVWEKSIDAMIIGARPHLKEIIGKRLGPNTLSHLLKKGADPCGEWGEYHTFVLHAPFFKGKINLDEYLIVEEERGCILKPSSWHSLYF